MDNDILINLDNKENEEEEIDECCICLTLLQGELVELSCGHVYHLECVTEWISKKNNYRKACCICENDTEIVNIFYKMKTHKYKIEEQILERKISNKNINYVNDTNYVNDIINNTSQNIINQNNNILRDEYENDFNYNTLENHSRENRNTYKCCNIL